MVRTLETPLAVKAQTHQWEKHWDFTGKPERQVTTTVVTAGANANDDVAVYPFFATGTRAVLVTDGFVMVSANSDGIGAADTAIVAITNNAGTAVMTKTFANETITANTSYNMGAVTSGYLAANTALLAAITTTTNSDLNSAVCCISIGYVPADSFMNGLKVVATDGGSVTVSDGVKGVLAMTPSDASAGDNDEIYLCTDTELFKMAAGASFEGWLNYKYAEVNTDDANVFFGFTNAFAANILVDDGAGPKATGDYIGFWKVDGGTQWYIGAQSNGTATPTADALGVPNTTAGTTTYKRLHIKVVCESSTMAIATFTVDGVCLGNVHFAYASATEMQLGVGLKNGTTTAETIYIDEMGCAANRDTA